MIVVKSKEELLKYFAEIGAIKDDSGWWSHRAWEDYFVPNMFSFCGEVPSSLYAWEDCWLKPKEAHKITLKEFYATHDKDFNRDLYYVELYINEELYDTFDDGGADRRQYQAESVAEGYKLALPDTEIEVVKCNVEEGY